MNTHTHIYIYVDCICIYIYILWLVSQWQPVEEPFTKRPAAKRSANPFFHRVRPNVLALDALMSNVVSKLKMSSARPSSVELHQLCRPRQRKWLKHKPSRLPKGCLSPYVSAAWTGCTLHGWRFAGRQCLAVRTWELPLDSYAIHNIYIYTRGASGSPIPSAVFELEDVKKQLAPR